jgi:DNA-binding IclR family transcriptional regulator
MLSTVLKIAPVLWLFTAERPEWRSADIARALGMPKSSAHTLVKTMAEIGLLAVSSDGRYRLGWTLLTLSERMRTSQDFCQHALPEMEALSRRLRETVLLAVLDRTEVTYVERVEGRHPMIRLAGVATGSRAPVHCTAVGKVLLASREPYEVRDLLTRAGMKAFTERTIVNVDDFERELVQVRARGYAIDRQEIVPEVACAAAPVRNRYGTVVAAMCVSMPAYRFPADQRTLIASLKAAAERLSRQVASTEASVGEAGDEQDLFPARVAAVAA